MGKPPHYVPAIVLSKFSVLIMLFRSFSDYLIGYESEKQHPKSVTLLNSSRRIYIYVSVNNFRVDTNNFYAREISDNFRFLRNDDYTGVPKKANVITTRKRLSGVFVPDNGRRKC